MKTAAPSLSSHVPLQHSEWMVVHPQGGSGQALDWTQLSIPAGCSLQGWVLAGGLNPSNVGEAIRVARPVVVDVSSGVCGPDGAWWGCAP